MTKTDPATAANDAKVVLSMFVPVFTFFVGGSLIYGLLALAYRLTCGTGFPVRAGLAASLLLAGAASYWAYRTITELGPAKPTEVRAVEKRR